MTAGAAVDPNTYYVKSGPVTFTVKGNEGFVEDTVTVKYLTPGASAYTVLTIGAGITHNPDGSYSFEMPANDVTIQATFKEGTASDTQEDVQVDSDQGISDLFNEGVSGSLDTVSDRATVDSDKADAVSVSIKLMDTYVLTKDTAFQSGVTYYTKVGLNYQPVTQAARAPSTTSPSPRTS